MQELTIYELEAVSGGLNTTFRPVSQNVEDRRIGWRDNSFWWHFEGVLPRFGSNWLY
ncbi:hypothetical protein ACFPVS_08210 [Neisseria weixii]|uniref:hypothetical protein n=1 Tax=Neisseria weixii TaxID=1853276 RepID=UPI0012FDD9A7|nr:hypothetical protein [Neisseria weixii]